MTAIDLKAVNDRQKAFNRLNNPERCLACDGTGVIVTQEPSTLYKCGFFTMASTCIPCCGSGRKMPLPTDFKATAAGDEQ